MKKAEGVRWAALEGDGRPPLPGGTVPTATTGGVKAPYASGRDWAKFDKALSAEAEEKKVANIIGHGKIRRGLFYQEGEAALNEMFQKIYADASDETKRAMNKSFQAI